MWPSGSNHGVVESPGLSLRNHTYDWTGCCPAGEVSSLRFNPRSSGYNTCGVFVSDNEQSNFSSHTGRFIQDAPFPDSDRGPSAHYIVACINTGGPQKKE